MKKAVNKADKRKKKFIDSYIKCGNIPDTIEELAGKGIDISRTTAWRYKNNPEIFDIINHKMGIPTRKEGLMEMAKILRSDKCLPAAKYKAIAFEKIAKAENWNKEQAENKLEIIIKKDFTEADCVRK